MSVAEALLVVYTNEVAGLNAKAAPIAKTKAKPAKRFLKVFMIIVGFKLLSYDLLYLQVFGLTPDLLRNKFLD